MHTGASVLPNTVGDPSRLGPPSLSSPLDRRHTYNTLIEDEPQDMALDVLSPQNLIKAAMLSSPPSQYDDLPTPRPMQQRVSSTISELTYSSTTSDWRRSNATSLDHEWNDLYDVTDDESEEVPLKCSASVKRLAADSTNSSRRSSRNRYPSLIIPSPSAWPTIQKLQKSAVTPMSPTGPMLSPAPNVLSMLSARLQVPATSATPSLDGSMTSEEMDHLSCPSTPDNGDQQENDGEWTGAPMQLQPQALETLHRLSSLGSEVEQTQVIELPEAEMAEVYRPPEPTRQPQSANGYESDGGLSPLSIPSPGGFFSSLGGSARLTWSVQDEPIQPTTCVAENFYNVPWRASTDEPVPRIVEITVEPPKDDCPTAKLTTLSGPNDEDEVAEIQPSENRYEYNPNYEQELQKVSTVNLDRTGSWLSAQLTYLTALRETTPVADPDSPSSPSSGHSRKKSEGSTSSPSKKSVRFIDDPDSPSSPSSGHSRKKSEGSTSSPSKKSVRFIDEPDKALPPSPREEEAPDKETVFVEAFEYLWENFHKTDAYIHRQTRADAMHILRRHLPSYHRDQLLGRYLISQVARPAPPRPVSSFYTDDPTVLKERIARAQKERQALEQVMPAVWVLQAQKYLNCGKLLSVPASKALRRTAHPRVLDLGGEAVCAWGWQVAFDHKHATVQTILTSPSPTSLEIEGPSNHKVTVVPNFWTLPFPSGHFDVISARTLYSLLKATKPIGKQSDELDLCLKECLRCLKPGGYIDFSVLDADIMYAGPLAQTMSAEFAFNLKTRGYDPSPTKAFLSRLTRAGFAETRRSWTFLPMGQTAASWNDTLAVGVDGPVSAANAAAGATEKVISPSGEVKLLPPAPVMGNTRDVAALTGLVGSWEWEKWMAKLQVEMGKDEERLLEGVPAVFEEGAKTGAGWRCLSGWARKAW